MLIFNTVGCIYVCILTVLHILYIHGACSRIAKKRLYLDMHGLVFETSICPVLMLCLLGPVYHPTGELELEEKGKEHSEVSTAVSISDKVGTAR